ncbi:MAG: roadblock/LC7 domain-containing protein [Anaerolineae bacterium]
MELNLSSQQLAEIEDCLHNLRHEGRARYVLVADTSGQLIESAGHSAGMEPSVLAALAAGEIAATREIANLMDEGPGFKLLLHEGKRQSIYLSEVDEALILAAIFQNTTPIGMVRLFTRLTVENLKDILEQPQDPGEFEEEGTLRSDFDLLLSQELDLSFGSG